MRLLLLFLLALPGTSLAQKNIGREAFMINIRPVLNGILGDFYQMISLFPDFPKDINPIIKELEGLTSDKEALKDACPRLLDKNCLNIIQSLREKLTTTRARTLTLMTQSKMSPTLSMSSLSGLRLITDFDGDCEEIKSYLDNTAFLMAAGISQRKETYFVIKKLDELSTLLSLAVVEYVPFTYKEEFRHFYFNFVHPLQLQISKNKNYEFINRNINSLNFSLNLLNQNLTKRNKKTPEGMAPFLSTIHNRWNSLLRYYY